MVRPHTRAVQKSATTLVCFEEFADLPASRDVSYTSTKFECLGHKWSLEIYPGGDEYAAEGMTSVYLRHISNEMIHIAFSFSFDGYMESETYMNDSVFEAVDDDRRAWGYEDYVKRSRIMENLVEGALVIEVHMKLINPPTASPPFVPENSSCKIIQGLFMDEESADIAFEVGGRQFKSNARENSPVRFPAHQLILRKCSSTTLAELCRSAGDKTTSSIQISDVSPDVFRHLLFHLYGGEVAKDDMKSHAKEILEAADRYGVINLKLAAEACLVKITALSIDNFFDLLLFADSKNCALLKEAAIDFMLENRDEVHENVSFHDAPGALISDILTALGRKEKKEGLRGMRVNDLRWRAHEIGLDVDGSREMLIAALEGASDEEYRKETLMKNH